MKLCLKCLIYISSKRGGKEKMQVFVKAVVLFAVPLSSEKLCGVITNTVCEAIVDVAVTVYCLLITIKCRLQLGVLHYDNLGLHLQCSKGQYAGMCCL